MNKLIFYHSHHWVAEQTSWLWLD